jgi:hypothetical protein
VSIHEACREKLLSILFSVDRRRSGDGSKCSVCSPLIRGFDGNVEVVTRDLACEIARISHQFGSWFSGIAGFREILRFAQNDKLKLCVILRGGLCPEESLRRFEGEEIFLADVIAACEKCGLADAFVQAPYLRCEQIGE